MLFNEPPTCIASPIKRTESQSSMKSPNNFDIDCASVFAENETIADDIQPRVLFNDTSDYEEFYPKVDETNEQDNVSPTWTFEKKKIQCCSNRIGFIPFISSVAIFINIMALVIIALNIITPTQLSTTTPIKEILLVRSSVISSFVLIRDSIEISSYYSSSILGCYLMQTSVQVYNESVYNVSRLIPPTFDHSLLRVEHQHLVEVFFPMWDNWTTMNTLICNQTISETNETFYSVTNEDAFAQFLDMYNETFKHRMEAFELELTSFLDGLYQFCHGIDLYTTGSGISVLVLSCLSCVIVIPVGLFVFMVLGRKLNVNDKKLKTANNFMLKDTMADVGMREQFRVYCRKSKVEIPFKILERIQFFKEHCKESMDIQLKLFEITKDYVARKNSAMGNNTKDIIIKQVSNEIEKKISHLERMKYETIFEIMELIQMESVDIHSIGWVVHQIDLYNNREDSYESIDIIHSKVMDNLEREVSDFLTYTHFQFKSTNGLNMNSSPNSPTSIIPTQI